MDIDRLVAVVHTTEATRLPEVSPTLTSRGHEMPAGAILAPERRATGRTDTCERNKRGTTHFEEG